MIDWLGWGFRPFSIIFLKNLWEDSASGGCCEFVTLVAIGLCRQWLWVYGVGACGFVPVVAMGFVVDMSLVMGLCRWWYH